jgi:hypothetical protein
MAYRLGEAKRLPSFERMPALIKKSRALFREEAISFVVLRIAKISRVTSRWVRVEYPVVIYLPQLEDRLLSTRLSAVTC